MNDNWLPHLKDCIPISVSADKISMYTVALEGWRRGLPLKFYTVKYGSRREINYSFEFKGKEYKFAVSKGEQVTKEAMRISKDKSLTKESLSKANVPVPEGTKFGKTINNETILEYADTIGYPVVLKPANANLGKGVIPNIHDRKELANSLEYVRKSLGYSEVIVEKHFEGEEYRVYVIAGQVIGAMNRIPANITGDGKSTIQGLIKRKNKERRKNPNLRGRPIKIDNEVKKYVKQAGYTLDSILEADKKLFLRKNSNLSSGGESIDVTDELTKEMKDIAVGASEAISGLVQCGVDIIVNKEKNSGAVIEVNTRPGIGGHLYPKHGKARDIPKAIIDYYFPETKSEISNPKFYFDYKSIKTLLNSGISEEVIVPPIPSGDIVVKTFEFSGDIQSLSLKRWIQRRALSYDVHGFIEPFANNKAMVVAVGNESNVKQFINHVKDVKNLEINLTEDNWNSPIKIGFEIKRPAIRKRIEKEKTPQKVSNEKTITRKIEKKELTFQQKLYKKYGDTFMWRLYKQVKGGKVNK